MRSGRPFCMTLMNCASAGHKGAQQCRAEGCAGTSACHPGHDGEQCSSSHGLTCLRALGLIAEGFTSE